MSKIYSLLRSNKLLGPYSAEELKQLDLKPTDLVWVEGNNGGWRYPADIEALKNSMSLSYREEKPQQRNVYDQPPREAHEEIVPITPVIYVNLPERTDDLNETNTSNANEMAVPAESFDERVQRMQDRVALVANGTPQQYPVTKYARSLDDIKNEYSSWLSKKRQSRKQRFSRTQLMTAAGVVLFFLLGFLTYNFISSQQTTNKNALSLNQKRSGVGMPGVASGSESTNNSLEENGEYPEAPFRSEKKELITEDHVVSDHIEASAPAVAPTAVNATAAPVKSGTERKLSARQVNFPEARQAAPARQETARPSQTVKNRPAEAQPILEPEVAIPLNQLVSIDATAIKAKKGVGGLELKLHNNYDQLLRVVAVDVMYHNASGLVQKETLYFTNVAPGKTVTKVAPSNERSNSIRYTVGLVSSAKSEIYYSK